MDETNNMGQNLLMLSAIHGQYELVATAINLGTDLDKMDQQKMTALKYSQDKGYALCMHYLYIVIDSLSIFISDAFFRFF